MSRLVARLLFCMLMFPVAVVVYCATVLTMERINGPYYYYSENFQFECAGVSAWAFVAIYWTLLWYKSVRWNTRRTVMPLVLAILGVGVGVIADFLGLRDGHLILLGILIPALWLISTVYYWRETPAERAERLRSSGRSNISCPTCGYNLTGLNEARCPECGSKFTLDELLAAQREQTAVEIE